MTTEYTDDELLETATDVGFDVITDPFLKINPDALRLLDQDSNAIGFDVAGDVLSAIMCAIPTPAEFSALEKEAGMPITLSIATPTVFNKIKSTCNYTQDATGVPLGIGPTLREAIKQDASDVHLSVGQHPAIRIKGALVPLTEFAPLSVNDMKNAGKWVANENFEAFNGDYDCAFSYANYRWRANLYWQRSSLSLAIRKIPSKVPQLDTLGLPDGIRKLAGLSTGLVLFCGATGSGKSTSIAALLDRINRTREVHILTIEEPIEYLHTSKRAIVHQREVGTDTESFARGLKSALRQDPDVLLVGELRDLETMSMALTAAETGHLVFATVHASSTDEAFNRIISEFPPVQQDQVRTRLAAVMEAVVAQQLLPGVEDKRVLATEILLGTNGVSTMIRENRFQELASVLDSSREVGMKSFDLSLAELFVDNKISQHTARTWARDLDNHLEHVKAAKKRKAPNDSLNDFDELDNI